MAIANILECLKPCAFKNLLEPAISVRSTDNRKVQRENHDKLSRFFSLTTRAVLAGLGALALNRLVGFSSNPATAFVTSLGCFAVSTPATLIGLGSYRLYQSISLLIPAIRARAFSHIAAAFVTGLMGWLVLNNYARITNLYCEATGFKNFGLAEKPIKDFNEYAANWLANYLYTKPVKENQTMSNLDFLKPHAFMAVVQPLMSVRTTSQREGEPPSRSNNEETMDAFFSVANRAALAGLGALAFCKLVNYSSSKAAAAILLGSITSLPATLIGLGSYGIYKGFLHMIQAASARSLSGVASGFAVLLMGWVALNNFGKISKEISEMTNTKFLGVLETPPKFLGDLGELRPNRHLAWLVANYLYTKPVEETE